MNVGYNAYETMPFVVGTIVSASSPELCVDNRGKTVCIYGLTGVSLNSSKCNLSIFIFLFFFLYILIRLIEYYLFLLSDNRNSQGNESSMQQNVRYSLYT